MSDTTPDQTSSTTPTNAGAADAAASVQAIDPGLLEILVCPLTRSSLELQGQELVAKEGGLRYPVREGIPIMLITEAALPEGVGSLDELKQKYAATA